MGSTSYLNKSKFAGYKAKSGSSGASDKEMNGKLRRSKIRRPTKMNDYGLKRVPDYTELAYKEAVSKLRFFLSGNSAPSVRSYGGSISGKNLEESDGDLDKKYSTYNTLSEYKPRPRLTAKYATLYADSLNNYTPQPQANTVPVSSAATGDLTGGTNPDVVNFIQKQEEYIEQLERESQYCRDELNNLLGKVKEVISENEHLHEAQKNKLISRMFHSYNAGSETDELDDVDSTGLDSDNKMTTSKSRRQTKSRTVKLEGPNIVFESRIAELEAQLTQAKIDLKKVQEENNENKRKLAAGLVDSTCLDGFKRQIDNLQRDKSTLESQISKLKLSLEQKEGDADLRYKRGTDVIEHQLREERNNLETEVRRLKEELASERGKVRELAGEGARRMLQERSAAEQRYTAHFDQLQHDLAAQYDHAAKLQLDLERQRREENDLKRELSMKNAAIDELKMELKNKSGSLQADLAQAHAEKASLEEELASARLALERLQRQAKHEANRLNSEIQSLRQRLDRADADLVHSRRENLRLSEQISTLEKEINMKNLTPLSQENNKKEKELSTMLESMENKHAKTVAELECMIQSQNSLMEKLTGECRLLTDKLDDANRRHKEELATMQRQIENLGQSLQQPYTHTPSPHEAFSPHTTAANRISHSPPNIGQNYTRSESTRNSPLGENNGVSRNNVNDHYETHVNPQNNISDDTTNYQEHNVLQDPTRGVNEISSIDSHLTNNEIHPSIPMESEDRLPYEQTSNKIKSNQDSFNKIESVTRNENNDITVDNMSDQNKQQIETELESKEQHEVEKSPQFAEQEESKSVEQEKQVDNENYSAEQYGNYDQNFEQPQYPEQYENYEQYPQQYSDPNNQYEGQYANYEADPNYEQNYDNTQNYENSQYNQEYNPQYSETVTDQPNETNDTTPVEKVVSQS